jgi:cytochrome c biogenesis factor
MAVHPPPQLLGFIAYTIPFAFAVATLATGRKDGAWVVDARRWSLFAWTMLTAGLLVGELWSYLELGWGGYWGWDPVENAALLPWLTGTAMLHTFSVEYRTGLLRRWNVSLACLTFLLTIFATFLTRSQLIQSLHSFSGSLLTPFFLWYQVVLLAVSVGLIAWRWRVLRSESRIESFMSREALVVATAMLLLMAVFVVMWGTLLPKFSESPAVLAVVDRALAGIAGLTGSVHVPLTGAVQVGPEWFNKAVGPIGIAVLAMTALGPLFSLRQAPGQAARGTVWRTLFSGVLLALGILVALVLVRGAALAEISGMAWSKASWLYLKGLSWPGVYGLAAVTFALQVLAVSCLDWVRSVRARRVAKGESPWTAAGVLFRENPRRYGGHLVHVGVALSFLGFAGAAGKLEKKDIVLAPLEATTLGGRNVLFLGTRDRWDGTRNYAALEAHFQVSKRGEPVSDDVVERVRNEASGAIGVDGASPPFLKVRFSSEAAAREYLVTQTARVTLASSLALVGADQSRRQVRLVVRRPEVLRVLPETLRRFSDAAKIVVAGAGGDRLSLKGGGRGDPTMTVTATEDGVFQAFLAGWSSKGEQAVLAARPSSVDKTVVEVVAAGGGLAMSPEVRFYVKSENPTTEVEIEPGLLTDLYLAATPAKGAGEVNLTAMDHPMMSSLWAGALVILLAGSALLLPTRRRKSRIVSAVKDPGSEVVA